MTDNNHPEVVELIARIIEPSEWNLLDEAKYRKMTPDSQTSAMVERSLEKARTILSELRALQSTRPAPVEDPYDDCLGVHVEANAKRLTTPAPLGELVIDEKMNRTLHEAMLASLDVQPATPVGEEQLEALAIAMRRSPYLNNDGSDKITDDCEGEINFNEIARAAIAALSAPIPVAACPTCHLAKDDPEAVYCSSSFHLPEGTQTYWPIPVAGEIAQVDDNG